MTNHSGAGTNWQEAAMLLRETADIYGRVERNPYGMMAGALGVGFVLGGGVFTRVTAHVVGTGLRIGLMAALPILQERVVAAIDDASPISNEEEEI